ncbi:tetratricopeptide repeat protein [Shewanella pneumatophori]|uniref:Tetratricopeptide repeat protein n=1 Tax=Shewanella pneumatophori TaxID=314092 RepID=A0A9X2CID3_9GAMM|nr:tetratricopeptide repeat protein [Shewanella pneumatophori]MCL1139309.1 tetratricopeptide repeat protein [Shewanella pneumatophori]
MSVINKMLKDLDKRQQPHGIESMARPQASTQPNRASKKPILLASGLSLVIGGLAVFITLNFTGLKQAPDELVVSEEQKQVPIQKLNRVEAPIASATESAAQVQTQINSQPNSSRQMTAVSSTEPQIANSPKSVQESDPSIEVQESSNVSSSKPATNTAKPVSVTDISVTDTVVATEVAKVTDKPQAVKVAQVETKPLTEKVDKAAQKLTISHQVDRSAELHSSSNMAVTEVKLSPQQLAQKQLQLATDAQAQGLHSDALTYYLAALEYDPSLEQARKQAAALYYGQNKLPQAAQLLEQGRLLFPQQYEFSLLLARVLQASGQNQQALLSLNAIPDSSEFAVEKWHQQSDLAQKQKDYPVAEKSFRQLAQQEPSQGRWWMGLGYALDAQQKYSDAKQAYHQALLQDNLSAQAKVYVDNRLLQLGAY